MNNAQGWAYQMQLEERRFKYELANRRKGWIERLKKSKENLQKINDALFDTSNLGNQLIKED